MFIFMCRKMGRTKTTPAINPTRSINLEEAHQQQHPPHPAHVEDQPSTVPSAQHSATPITMEHIMEYIRASTEHIQLQNASNHKGILHIQQGLYHGSSQGQNNPWMTPTGFNNYLSWPGDRHNFSGEAEASGVGNRVGGESEMRAGEEDVTGFYAKDAQEMRAGPSGATEDEDPNQV